MRTFSRAAIAALIIGMPFIASGQTVAELQAQIQSLLTQLTALQSQLSQLPSTTVTSGTGTTGTTAGTQTTGAACPQISRILKAGMSGADVSALQRFLASDPSIYPEGLVTGYYGSLTTAAVQRWQAAHSIVSSGTPETTGFGQVGPTTAAKLALACGAGPAGTVGGIIQVSPVSGSAPLAVTVQATVNTVRSCGAATYTLNWGDLTPLTTINVPAGNCGELQQSYAHTYYNGGTYTVTLASGNHQSTTQVQVTGATNVTTTGTTLPQQQISASATSGNAPFTVTFTGVLTSENDAWCQSGCTNTLEFGDGTTATIPLPAAQNSANTFSVQHTYANAGTYTVELHQGSLTAASIVGSPLTITVSGQAAPTETVSADPMAGPAPLRVTFTGVVTGNDPAWCSNCSDTLIFGDGQSVQIPLPSSSSGANQFTVEHTYVNAGSYVAVLYPGDQTAGFTPIGAETISVASE